MCMRVNIYVYICMYIPGVVEGDELRAHRSVLVAALFPFVAAHCCNI